MRSIRRYTIAADGKPHTFKLCYDPLYASRGLMRDELYFWAEHDDDTGEFDTQLMVTGDGAQIPPNSLWIASVETGVAGSVWHLLQLGPPGWMSVGRV